ncbi:thioesterase domain protein [Mycena sanguinolenta]|nr:thioesterase domain protein [Mycena sanguinolenta]
MSIAGEILDVVAGYPCLYRYSAGNSNGKPLLVFLPGGFHLARIAYGGHEGSRPEDFLVHWLNREGFNVLAISYPLQTEPEIMPATCPGFRTRDWGQQAAEVTKGVIEAHQLPTEILLGVWSMAGRVVVPFTKAAEAMGVRVQLCVALAATPGFTGSLLRGKKVASSVQCSNAGYASSTTFAKACHAQIRAQAALNDIDSAEIMSEAAFMRDYCGNTPVSLLGYTLKYDSDSASFVDDAGLSAADSQMGEFASFPWIATLYPDSELDARHTLVDKAAWGFIFTMKLTTMVEIAKIKRGAFGESWQRVAAFVAAIPERLSARIEGNHFFFVGEKGARETAKMIASHWETCKVLRSELGRLLQ